MHLQERCYLLHNDQGCPVRGDRLRGRLGHGAIGKDCDRIILRERACRSEGGSEGGPDARLVDRR